MSLRERIGNWLLRDHERAAPITFAPETQGTWFGNGIATNQASDETLLRENLGVADMATRAIANRIGSLIPVVKTSRKTSQGTIEDEELDDHVLKLLLDNPHPNFSKQQIFRLTGQWITTTGDAYWLKVRNRLGAPAMLQPMPPQYVDPVVQGGMIEKYHVRDGKGNQHRLDASEVIRFWWPDPETLYTAEGYLGPNAINTDAARFATEHLRSQYQNDATPGIILKAGADAAAPNDEQWSRWQQDYSRKYHNRSGTHRGLPAMLPTGWDAIMTAISTGADITPLLDYWQSNQLMNFGVPASVLGRVVSGDRSSAETNQYVFDMHTIEPIAQLIAEALTVQLAAEFDSGIFVEFAPFISADKEFDLKREAQDLTLKVKSGQQVLADRGADPEAASWAEFPVGTLADQPYTGESVDMPLPQDDPSALFEPDEDEEPRKRLVRAGDRAGYRRQEFSPKAMAQRAALRERKYRPKFQRALRGIFEAQRKAVIKRLKSLEPDDRARVDVSPEMLFDPEEWLHLFELRTEPIRKAAYLAAATDTLGAIGLEQSFIFTEAVANVLREQGATMVVNTTTTTVKRLQKALVKSVEEGEGISQLTSRINDVFSVRRRNAETIARTELGRAQVAGQLESYKQSGVVEKKEWLDNRDPEVRDSHVGSLIAIVGINEKFTLPSGHTCDGPLDSRLPVEEVANCRCDVLPVFEEA